MFDLAAKRLVWIPVNWKGVQAKKPDELAEPVTHEIEVQVEIVDNDRLREILGEQSTLNDIEKFSALVSDWRGVKAGQRSVSMTPENIEKILAVPMFSTGFETCYLAAWSGRIEARMGNSNASSSDGPADEAPESLET